MTTSHNGCLQTSPASMDSGSSLTAVGLTETGRVRCLKPTPASLPLLAHARCHLGMHVSGLPHKIPGLDNWCQCLGLHACELTLDPHQMPRDPHGDERGLSEN